MISKKKKIFKRVTPEYTEYRFIDAVWREVNPVGFCMCNAHKGYVSTELLKKHTCLRKQCPFLIKYKDHPYWSKREKIAQLRKERKEKYK